MKLSVSLPADDVGFLDAFAREQGLESRSAAVHQAVRLLRTAELGAAYQSAWEQWTADGDAESWESTVGDGLTDGVAPDATR
jgi:Arc/MetJ-type ribon-helix-helix transcriptional regulator